MGQKLVDQWSSSNQNSENFIDNAWVTPVSIQTDLGNICKYYATVAIGLREFYLTVATWAVSNSYIYLILHDDASSKIITPSTLNNRSFTIRTFMIDKPI